MVKRFRKRVVRKNALDNIGVAARTISRDNREPVRAEWSRVQEKKVSSKPEAVRTDDDLERENVKQSNANLRIFPFFSIFRSIFQLYSRIIRYRVIEFKANLKFFILRTIVRLFVCSFRSIATGDQKLETVTIFLTLDGIHERIIVRSGLQSESKLTLTDVMACSLEAESIYERIAFVSPFKDFISQVEISVSMYTRKIYLLGVTAFFPLSR